MSDVQLSKEVLVWAISKGLLGTVDPSTIQERYNDAHPQKETRNYQSKTVDLLVTFVVSGEEKARNVRLPGFTKPKGKNARKDTGEAILGKIIENLGYCPDAETVASIKVSELSEPKSLVSMLTAKD